MASRGTSLVNYSNRSSICRSASFVDIVCRLKHVVRSLNNMRDMVDVHIDLAGLEDLFEGSDQIVDAAIRVQSIRNALLNRSGEADADDVRAYAPTSSRLPEITQALAIIARIERAAHVKNKAAGLAACGQLRTFGRVHNWLGFE
jgi:hypothetical protein